MRSNYPLLSEELNDILLTMYSHYTYLLGYDDINGYTTYSGIYDIQESTMNVLVDYITLKNTSSPTNNTPIPYYLDSQKYYQKLRSL